MEIRPKTHDSQCWHVACSGLIGMFGITGFEQNIAAWHPDTLLDFGLKQAPPCKKDEAIKCFVIPPVYSYAPICRLCASYRLNMLSCNGGVRQNLLANAFGPQLRSDIHCSSTNTGFHLPRLSLIFKE